jgi:hypothetical protein
MDINIQQFKKDAQSEMIVKMGDAMSSYVLKRIRHKNELHPKLLYEIIKDKISKSNHIFDVVFIDDSQTILFIVKAIGIHYVAEIEPLNNTYDILNEYLIKPKSGEIIENF